MAITTGLALLGAAGIGAGASFVSAAKGRTAARRAGQRQEAGIQSALDLQREQLGIAREDLLGGAERAREGLQPFQEFGTGAISPLQNLLQGGGDIGAFLEGTPGFQAALEGGTRAIDVGAAGAGLLGSGARAKELTRFGQRLATQTLGQERNALFRAADIGRTAAGEIGRIETGTAGRLAGRGSVFATQASNLLTGKGAVGAETIRQRNTAFQTGLQGVTQAGTNILGTLSTPGIFG